jgi:hypothetical protein
MTAVPICVDATENRSSCGSRQAVQAGVLFRKAARKAAGVPARLAALSLAAPFVRDRLAHRYSAALSSFQADTTRFADLDWRIVEGLRASGVYVTSLDALGIDRSVEMLRACAELAAQYREMHLRGALNSKDAFQASAADLMARRVIFDWGLNERLLDIAAAYLCQPVAYDGLNLFYTKADGREVSARKWHRDLEDRRVLKVAVYVSDVDDDAGPFQILKARVAGADSDCAPNYRVFTQEALEKHLGRRLDEGLVTTCKGPAGTVVFAETARFYHRGKPATTRDRCAAFFNYFTRTPLRPFFCERGTLSRRQLAELCGTLSERQRESVLWRETLPLLMRLVPPAPI